MTTFFTPSNFDDSNFGKHFQCSPILVKSEPKFLALSARGIPQPMNAGRRCHPIHLSGRKEGEHGLGQRCFPDHPSHPMLWAFQGLFNILSHFSSSLILGNRTWSVGCFPRCGGR